MKPCGSKFFYSKEASVYDKERWLSGVGQYIDQTQKEIVRAILSDISGKKILDTGAGTGRFSLSLAEMGGEVTALDISQEMLDVLKENAEKSHLSEKISTIQADASQKIPFPDETFDFCIAINTLSHIKDARGLFKEVRRILKPNGIFLSNYPNLISVYFPFGVLVNLRGRSLWKKVFTRWYSLHDIRSLYKTNKFSIETIKGQVHFSAKINNRMILTVLQFIDRLFRNSSLKYIAPTIFVKAIRK